MLSKEVSSTIFWVFGMTRPGSEHPSPGPMVNTLFIRPINPTNYNKFATLYHFYPFFSFLQLYKICFLKLCCWYYLFELESKLENCGTYCLKLPTKGPTSQIFSQYTENLVVYPYIVGFFLLLFSLKIHQCQLLFTATHTRTPAETYLFMDKLQWKKAISSPSK